MRERARIILVLVVAVVALGLAGGVAWLVVVNLPGELTKAEAARLLRSSDFMAEMATTRLVLYRNHIFPAADLIAEHRDTVKFVDLGLVEVRPGEVLWGRPIGAKFVLTPEGEQAAATGWRSTSGPGGEEAWIVPTARKELVRIANPVTYEESAECSFTWRWVPTKIGDKTGAFKSSETGSASFHLDRDRWYLDESSIVRSARK
jgi:hypothetical protein